MKPIRRAAFLALLLGLVAGCGGPGTDVNEAEDAAPAVSETTLPHYTQRDTRDEVVYFVLPDRFDNGDPGNDLGDEQVPASYGGHDPTHKGFFHGGDFAGLARRLDYLQEMGITAIWMTPILRNKAVQMHPTQGASAGYHGYWILDFTQIDPHWGGDAELKALIDAAHARNMKVYFDIITNHTADVIKLRGCHDERGMLPEGMEQCPYRSLAERAAGNSYTPFIPAGEENAKTPAWLNDVSLYNNQGDTTFTGEDSVYGDFAGLDDLDTRLPAVVDGFIDIYRDIITRFRPDGFRVDTVKHVDLSFWQAFTPAILAHAKSEGIENFHVFGEVYSPDPAFLSTYTTAGNMPSVLDFALADTVERVIAKGEPSSRFAALIDADDLYSDADSDASQLMNFISNHDAGRFGYFMNRAQPEADDSELLARSILGHAFMFFARGVPVVYYGDEQGFTGDGNDQDAREDMMASQVASYNDNDLIGTDSTTATENFDRTHPIYLSLREIAGIYRAHPALRRGLHINRYSEPDAGLYAFSRVVPDENIEYLVVMNADSSPRDLVLQATSPSYTLIAGDATLGVTGETISLQVPAIGFAVLRADSAHAAPAPAAIGDLKLVSQLSETGILDLELTVAGLENEALPYAEIVTEVVDRDGTVIASATDWTPPYAARLRLPEDMDSEGLEIRLSAGANPALDTSATLAELRD